MIYEMYVQIRDVYTANKDGVSVFIRTDRRGILPSAEGQGEQVRAAVGQSGQQGDVSERLFFSSCEGINSSKVYRNSLLLHKNRLSFSLCLCDPTLVSV